MMLANNNRLFIALPVIPEHRLIVAQWSQALKEKWSFKRWLHTDDYHITIKFLGECNPTAIQLIHARLDDLCQNQSPFTLSISGFGTFDSRESTKILWAGVEGELTKLHQFQSIVETEMEQLGFAIEKNSYRPHITMARNYQGGILTEEQLASMPSLKNTLSWTANEVILYQTFLGMSPAYHLLASFAFQGNL